MTTIFINLIPTSMSKKCLEKVMFSLNLGKVSEITIKPNLLSEGSHAIIRYTDIIKFDSQNKVSQSSQLYKSLKNNNLNPIFVPIENSSVSYLSMKLFTP